MDHSETGQTVWNISFCSGCALFQARWISPIEYLQQWRIALAKDALRRGDTTVGAIALNTGFQSASAFSTAFKRAVGCSPSRYSRER